MNLPIAKTASVSLTDVILTIVLSTFFSAAVFAQSGTCVNSQTRVAQSSAYIDASSGHDRHIVLSQPVFLDGSETTQRNGQRLAFNWQLVEKPEGSLVEISDARTV
ncbi:MAG: hypothetical protein AB8G18_09675 [Gammaproteobacteria bacterium]